MALDQGGALYPQQFEIYRLEALGDPPYLTRGEAEQRYAQGRDLTVTAHGDPPAWTMHVSTKTYRFTVAFHTGQKKLIRRVVWEQADGTLFCRRTIDRFYPAGEQQRPLIDVITVTQDLSTDGVCEVTISSPDADDEFRQIENLPIDHLRLPVPDFGDWQAILEMSQPEHPDRSGAESTAAARAYASQLIAAGDVAVPSAATAQAGWRVAVDAEAVLRTIDAIREARRADIPVIARGAARIVPLFAQGDPQTSGRDPREERRRMLLLADSIRDACDQRGGRASSFDLDQHGDGRAASYAAALRAAGAWKVQWWVFDPSHGAALVLTGSEHAGDLTLALHLVPPSWVSPRRAATESGDIDVRWTHADLVESLDAERQLSADSVAEQSEKDSRP